MATGNLKICRPKEFPRVILVGAIFFVIMWSAVWKAFRMCSRSTLYVIRAAFRLAARAEDEVQL